MGIKNARSNVGEPSRLNQMVNTAKMVILFESANFSRVFFEVGSQGAVVFALEVRNLLGESVDGFAHGDARGRYG